MQGRQWGNLADLFNNLFGDKGRLAEEFATVSNAVAN
jgi:hypothetical protein